MNIEYGNGTTEYGTGISISLTGNEVATAIDEWLEKNHVKVNGPRTITVNGEMCKNGHIYVDPSGSVVREEIFDGKGSKK